MNSPCVKVCVMDPERDLCRGCYRTLDEIARWGTMSDAERQGVMNLLSARKLDVAEASVPPLA